MLRYQKGYIFNGYTFVVNKEDIHNARDGLFVEAVALLPNSWISVKERLPEQRDDYLVCTEDAEVYVCEYIPSVKQWWNGQELICDGRITHWMPLPSPPGEEDNDG